jgi:hypothetical protein
MKLSGQRQWQLEEMTPVLEGNKKLQASVTQERHHREDLEVKVLALEKDHQLLEVENQSLAEQCSRSTNQQKDVFGPYYVDNQRCETCNTLGVKVAFALAFHEHKHHLCIHDHHMK